MVLELAMTYFGAWLFANWGITFLSEDRANSKSTDALRAIKSYKEASTPKKIMYIILPGIYFGIKAAKERRDELEREFAKKYGINLPEHS